MLIYIRNINGQEYWGISMGLSALSYIGVSLAVKHKPFNMDKLLNRGTYAIEGETRVITETAELGWKIFMMGKEFTKTDKMIYILNYVWTGMWTIVFIIGTVYNLSNEVGDGSWMAFWKNYIYIQAIIALITVVWFSIGGFKDLKVMMSKLKTDYRDHGDDGWVADQS